jgi:hypothetical protein
MCVLNKEGYMNEFLNGPPCHIMMQCTIVTCRERSPNLYFEMQQLDKRISLGPMRSYILLFCYLARLTSHYVILTSPPVVENLYCLMSLTFNIGPASCGRTNVSAAGGRAPGGTRCATHHATTDVAFLQIQSSLRLCLIYSLPYMCYNDHNTD